ncbi:Spt4/RpoE2 zinc finger-domain-containing protein [Daldinia loculata]|nr:Spt4/RpoE2 zinc finger-domain-containing protein [Daldinia loculata]
MNRVQQAKNNGARARLARQRANPAAHTSARAVPATPAASTNEAPGNEALSDEAASSHLVSTNNNGISNNVPDNLDNVPNNVPFNTPDSVTINTPDSVTNNNFPEQAVPTPEPSNQQAANQGVDNQDFVNQDFVNQGGAPNQDIHIPIPNPLVPNQGPVQDPISQLPPGQVHSRLPIGFFNTHIFEEFAYDPSEYDPYIVRLGFTGVPLFINDLILEGVVPLYLFALAPIQEPDQESDQEPDFQLFPDEDGNNPADENSYNEGLFEEEEVNEELEDEAGDGEADQEVDLSYYFEEHEPKEEDSNDDEEVSDGEKEDDSEKDCDQDESKDQGDDDQEDPDQESSNQGSNQEGSGHQGSDCEGSDPKGSDHKDSDNQSPGNKATSSKATNNHPSSNTASNTTSNMASQNLLGMVIAPNQWRYARACMVCSIIMTQSHFRAEGCPNCPFLDLKGSPEAIEACTSSQFEGTAAYFQPRRSWIARWQRVDTFVPGTYAIKVNGSLPEDIKQAIEDQGNTHIPRDGSALEID